MKAFHAGFMVLVAVALLHCGVDEDATDEDYAIVGVDIGRDHEEIAPHDPAAFADEDDLPATDVRAGNASGLPWRSGFAVAPFGDLAQLRALGAWRGRPVDIATTFIGQGSWDEARSIDDYCKRALSIATIAPRGRMAALIAANIVPTITFPMLIARHGGEFGRVVDGEYDTCHDALAARLRSIVGTKLIYVRVGHEADRGYPWSIADNGRGTVSADLYKRAFTHVAARLRRALPGVRIVWNTLRNPSVNLAQYYPGDDVVDVVSMDPYDNARSQPDPDEREYATGPNTAAWKNILGSYDRKTGRYSGIAGMAAFARDHGKRIAFDEWAPTNLAERRHESTKLEVLRREGSNNAFYTAAMFEFFSDNADIMEYETNFQAGSEHRFFPESTSVNPLAGKAYREAYKPR